MPIPSGYQQTVLTPKASRSVETFWSFTATESGRGVILPDGRCDVILRRNIQSGDPATPIITGPATTSYTVEYYKGESWIGMRLRPGSGVDIWADQIREAANKVLQDEAAIALMPELRSLAKGTNNEADLKAALANTNMGEVDPRITRALDALHLSGGRMRIERLAQFAGCSARHLNRLFRNNIGLKTKTYAQLVQFHRALRLIQEGNLSITAAAFEGGFADQAHLTRAFVRFAGFPPSNIPEDLSLPNLPG